ncbi:hypothetical protein DFP72DRAFT_1162505 [Ephemerocybe angulata]|uniref:Uncharacterized protein n=1 Tax=Ephemerocybe angulata TaxID=980116 RepID=A0A8H6IJN0_9AGAR|nr:hypothetical protein DFP72DRAFT_1162505 [Tulosesus angulatus]
MGKRKASSQGKSAPGKKVRKDESAVTTSTETTEEQATPPTISPLTVTEAPATGLPVVQPEGEEAITPTQVQATQDSVIAPLRVSEVQSSTRGPTETAKNGAVLDPDTLKRIFYEIIVRSPLDSTPGEFGTPWHFTGFRHSVINCAARATLRGVCKLWADLMDDEINLWTHIHIDGKRIPSPPKTWMKGWGREPENYAEPCDDDWNDLEVVNIVGEMPRAALSVERSQETPIDLVLVDPSYDPEPNLAEFGRPLLARPGLLDFIDAAMIGSLSISTEDIHFVKDLFNPGVHSDERSVYDDGMEGLTDTKKILLPQGSAPWPPSRLDTGSVVGASVETVEHLWMWCMKRPELCAARKEFMSDVWRAATAAERARLVELDIDAGAQLVWLLTSRDWVSIVASFAYSIERLVEKVKIPLEPRRR